MKIPRLHWIQSDGGPLVAMPFARRAEWEGTSSPSDGRIVKATFRWDSPDDPATDYDEAVDASSTSFGVVRRDGFDVLAMRRGPKTWRKVKGGIVLVIWEFGEGQKVVGPLLCKAFPDRPRDTEPVKWKNARKKMRVVGSKLVVFDAAYAGREAKPKQQLLIPLAAGTYALDEAEWRPNAETCMTLLRLRRSS